METHKIKEWYATRRQLDGNSLTREENQLLIGAHNYHYGQFGKGKLTPAQVTEYKNWERMSK